MSRLVIVLLLLCSCRGDVSLVPPVHLNLNMDFQKKYEAQETNAFFEDGRAMRPPVPGTVARGELADDDRLYRGKHEGKAVTELPVPLNEALLLRGKERFNIYCSPCHDSGGSGQGIVAKRGERHGMVAVPSFHIDRLRNEPIGHFFDVISNGVRTMPAYRSQIPVPDRWAISAYVRALQVSRSRGFDDIPADIVSANGWKRPPQQPNEAPAERETP